MKQTLTFLLLVVSLQFSLAQDHPDGAYKDYYSSGELFIEGQYKNQKRVGEWKQYHLNGEVSRIYSYTDGKLNEEEVYYFDDGIISIEVVKVDNDYIRYGYYESGKLKYERKEDSGYYKGFYEDGQLKTEANYIENELSGKWKSYDENGNLIWVVTYQDGYRHGIYQQYHKNGNLKVEGLILREKKEGAEMRYDENEILVWKGYYEADEFAKTWVKYNEKGKKVEKIKVKKNPSALNLKKTEVPDGVLERVPVYPGCEEVFGNRARKDCMSSNVIKLINKSFNVDIAVSLNLVGRHRIIVNFKIDKTGQVTDVKARGPHPALEEEAIRVIELIPNVKPGLQRGKPVVIPYSIPIVFQIAN